MVVAILTASLLGSVHCAGMCGGFLAMAVTPLTLDRRPLERGAPSRAMTASTTPPAWVLSAAYNLGRLATYATLGALAGLLGSAVDLGGELAGVQRAAAYASGGLMAVVGVLALARALGARVPPVPLPPGAKRLASRGYRGVQRWGPVARATAIGLLTTLLPCGWLYAFVVTAAGTGRPEMGVLVMAAFWVGTLPVMGALGAGVQRLSGPLRRHLPVVTAGLLIAVGALTLSGRVKRLTPTDLPFSRAGAAPVSCHEAP